MWRRDTLVGAGVGLLLGLAIAWAGYLEQRASLGNELRLHQRAFDALTQEIEELRREFKQGVTQAAAPMLAETQAKSLPVVARTAPAPAETSAPRGQITKIDAADDTVVEVNLGEDAGLAKHNNLEVVRGSSAPEHIGTLRVFEVHAQRAMCRLVSTNPLKKQIPRVGDEVSVAHAR